MSCCDCVQGVYSVHSVYFLHIDTATATERRHVSLINKSMHLWRNLASF